MTQTQGCPFVLPLRVDKYHDGFATIVDANGYTTTPPFGIVLGAYGKAMATALVESKLLGVRAEVVRR